MAAKKEKKKDTPSKKASDKKDKKKEKKAAGKKDSKKKKDKQQKKKKVPTEPDGPASAELRATCLEGTKFLIVAEPKIPDSSSKEETKRIKAEHKEWLKATTATLKDAGATVASNLKGEGDKAVTHVLSTRADYADQLPKIVEAVARGLPIMNYSFVSESLYAGKQVPEKTHLLTPFVPEMEAFEVDTDGGPPPEVSEDQRFLQDLRAEGAVSLTRNGQRLTVALAQNQNEVHVAAGSRRLGWGIAKAARRTGGLAAAGASSETGPLWSIASSWAPCCAGEGSRERKRTVTNAGERYAPAGPPFTRKPPGHAGGRTKPLTSRVLMAPKHRVTAFAIDPETDVLYTGSDAGGLLGWDLNGGVAFWTVPPATPAPGVRAVGVNAMRVCKGVLSVVFADGTMKGLDPHSGAELWAVEGGGVTTLIVAKGVIYMGCYDKSVRAVAADSGMERWSCAKHTDVVRAMAHAEGEETHVSGEEKLQSGGTLYTGGWDCVVRALDDQTGKQKWRNKRHKRPIASLSVSCGKDGGTILFSGSYDGTCRAIRTKDGSDLWKFNGHTQPVRAVCATALDPGGLKKKVYELENWVEMMTGMDLDGDGDVGILDRAGVVFTGSEDGTVCALDGCSGEMLWTHARHTRRVVEVTVCDSIVFSVADDQTTRAIAAKTGQELWCSRWAWGRHGPPPDRGNIWAKAINWTEKKTGLDIDGDGDVGALGGESHLIEDAINKVEKVTGVDIDGDGDVGVETDADAALAESLRSLGLSPESPGSSRSPPVQRLSPLLLPGSPSSPLPTTEELMRQLHGFPASPGYEDRTPPAHVYVQETSPLHAKSARQSVGKPQEEEEKEGAASALTPREVVHARDAWEDAKDRVAALEASIDAEKESMSWVASSPSSPPSASPPAGGTLAEKVVASRSRRPGGAGASAVSERQSADVELNTAQREWEAAKAHAAQLEMELLVASDNVMVGQRAAAHRKTVDRVANKIAAIYRLKNPRKVEHVDALLEEWAGEEEELLKQIEEKYRVDDGDLLTEEDGPGEGLTWT